MNRHLPICRKNPAYQPKAKVVKIKSPKEFPRCSECDWVDKYRKMKTHLQTKH